MRKLVTALVLAAAIPTLAHAGTITGEYRDVNTTPGASEVVVQAWDKVGKVNVGAEIQSLRPDHNGPLSAKLSVKLGPVLSDVAGFKPTAYVELGRSDAAGKDFEFWGVALKASRAITGPLSGSIGYRHREGFTAANLKEDRFDAGLAFDLSKHTAFGVNYYRTHANGQNSDAVGFAVTRKF
jgi:hypothetical protein